MNKNYIILVKYIDDEKAIALATLLKSTIQFHNVHVEIIVVNNENQIVTPIPCPLGPFEIAQLFLIALEKILILKKLL